MNKCLKAAFIVTLICLFVTSLFIVHPTFAAESDNIAETIFFGNLKEDGSGCGVFTILNNIIDILSFGIGILGIIGITIVGIRYLTAGNNVEQAEKAKRRIPQIVLGLIIYALLYAGLQFLMPGGKLDFSQRCDTISSQELADLKAKEKAEKEEANKNSNVGSSSSSKNNGSSTSSTTTTNNGAESATCKGKSSTKTKKAKGTGYSRTIKICEKKFKLFTQCNSAWGKNKFGHNVKNLNCTVCGCGCGANSIAIILSGYGLNKNTGSVAQSLIKTAKSNGYKNPTSSKSMRKYLKSIGFKSKNHSNNEGYKKTYNAMRKALMDGHQLVVYVGVGGNKSSWSKFTSSGYHFICVLGIDPSNNKVFVGNPTGSGNRGWYKLSDVAKAVRSGQFWLEVYK